MGRPGEGRAWAGAGEMVRRWMRMPATEVVDAAAVARAGLRPVMAAGEVGIDRSTKCGEGGEGKSQLAS